MSNLINDWLLKVAEGTRRKYREHFSKFVESTGLSTEELLKKAKKNPKEVHNLALEYREELIKQNYANSTCALAYAAIRSFFSWNDINLGKMPRHIRGEATYEPESDVPTSEDLWKMIQAVNGLHPLRDRAIVLFLAQSGQRIGVLTALKWSMFKDQIDDPPCVIAVPPILINRLGKNVNKENVKYRFAIDIDTVQAIKLMMEERIRSGEPINNDSWLFRSYSKFKDGNIVKVAESESGECLSDVEINRIVRDSATKAGIQKKIATALGNTKYAIHAHTMRKFWKNQVRRAEWRDPELRDFLMGHQIPYRGAYDKFSDEYIREAYFKARQFLNIIPKGDIDYGIRKADIMTRLNAMPKELQKQFLEQALSALPYKEREMMENEEGIQAILSVEREKPKQESEDCQKIVVENDLPDYLRKGWKVVTTLPSGKIVIDSES